MGDDYLLTHYYEAAVGPFRSLTKLSEAEATSIQTRLTEAGDVFASQRQPDYLAIRRQLEAQVRAQFIEQGGKPALYHPHYLIVGESHWLQSWYRDGQKIQIPLSKVHPDSVSFTYGDTFPAMRYQDGKAYRGQVYCLGDLWDLIEQYGLPQDWNPTGQYGPDRYIEAQLWSDRPVMHYLVQNLKKLKIEGIEN